MHSIQADDDRKKHSTKIMALIIGIAVMLFSAHPQMALLRDFSVGRRDLNPQNSALFLRFKSDARLELTQNPSFVDGHYLTKWLIFVLHFLYSHKIAKFGGSNCSVK